MTLEVNKKRNKNKELIKFRVIDKDLSTREMAKLMGISAGTISSVELGTNRGSSKFWEKLQNTFNLTEEETARLIIGGFNSDK